MRTNFLRYSTVKYTLGEKSFSKTSFHLRIDGAEKGQKQGRAVVFLRSFISGLFLSFLRFSVQGFDFVRRV